MRDSCGDDPALHVSFSLSLSCGRNHSMIVGFVRSSFWLSACQAVQVNFTVSLTVTSSSLSDGVISILGSPNCKGKKETKRHDLIDALIRYTSQFA